MASQSSQFMASQAGDMAIDPSLSDAPFTQSEWPPSPTPSVFKTPALPSRTMAPTPSRTPSRTPSLALQAMSSLSVLSSIEGNEGYEGYEGTPEGTPAPGAEPRFVWEDEEIEALINEANEQCEAGMRADSGIKPQAYPFMVEAVKAVAPVSRHRFFTLSSCTTKYRGLKQDWKIWNELCNLSGWNKDPVTGCPCAAPEVMKAYWAAHKGSKKFATKPLQFEAALDQLFAGTAATGVYAQSIDSVVSGSGDTSTTQDESQGAVEQTANRRREAGELAKANKRLKASSASDKLSSRFDSLVDAILLTGERLAQPTAEDSIKRFVWSKSKVVEGLNVQQRSMIVKEMMRQGMDGVWSPAIEEVWKEAMVEGVVEELKEERSFRRAGLRKKSSESAGSEVGDDSAGSD